MNNEIKPILIDTELTIRQGKTAIIAEIGINHNGSVALAKEMIEAAWDNGADLIKLQSYRTDNFIAASDPSYIPLKELELSLKEQEELFQFAKLNGIRLFTTPFDLETLTFLDQFDLPVYKVASMDCTNYQLIEAIAKKGKPVILSTGMASENEIAQAVDWVRKAGNTALVLLHCVSDYPTAPENVNIHYMNRLAKQFHLPCGISEHTAGMDAAYLSVGMGAVVVEKHFTLKRNSSGKVSDPDQQVSMTPEELKKFSCFCRQAEILRGEGERQLTDNEKKGRACFRRGLYASTDIKEGEKLSRSDILSLRPVSEISAKNYKELLGKKTLRQFKKGEPFSWKGIGG